MSAPYAVFIAYPGGHQREIPCATFGEALAKGKVAQSDAPAHSQVSVIGDGYDVDCDGEGFFMSSDGLTDDERETLEEVGLS